MPKILFKSIRGICVRDREDEFKQERFLPRLAKITISRTSIEIVGMDFVDDGEDATTPRAQDTFFTYSVVTFDCTKRKGTNGGEMGANGINKLD